MTKKELEIIATALQHSRDEFAREALLAETKGERPKMVEYYRKSIIPEISAAYKIVESKYMKIK